MSYEGGKLVDLCLEVEKVTMVTGHRLADAAVEHGRRQIRQNTPVRTYHLRESYQRTAIRYHQDMLGGYTSVRWSAYAWTGEVFTEVEYAQPIEFGSGLWGPKHAKFKIEPKNPGGVLAFGPYERMPNGGVILDVQGKPKKGGTVFTRFVMHPGSPGHHMFQIGTLLTEAEYMEWSREPMRLFQEAIQL